MGKKAKSVEEESDEEEEEETVKPEKVQTILVLSTTKTAKTRNFGTPVLKTTCYSTHDTFTLSDTETDIETNKLTLNPMEVCVGAYLCTV